MIKTKSPDAPALTFFKAHSTGLILRTLQWDLSTATALAQAICTQSDDLLRVEAGSLYPALHRLVKRGWLKAEWGVSEANQWARDYQLTAAGKAQLLREQDRWSRLIHAIGRIMNPAPAESGEWRSAACDPMKATSTGIDFQACLLSHLVTRAR